MIFWLWVSALVAAVALYLRQVYSRFSRYGVKNFTPMPFVGNMAGIVLRTEHFVDEMNRTYKAFPEDRFVGKYEFTSPILLIRDLELVKKIAVKDYEYFLDHRKVLDSEKEVLFTRNLFFLNGQEWKNMRSTLSPAFTSSKIRLMVPFMVEVGDQMLEILKQNIKDSGTNYVDVDIKDLASRYAVDVIASCAFGFKVDSFVDKENQFYLQSKGTTSLTLKQGLMLFAFVSFPTLVKNTNLRLFSEATNNFFRRLVLGEMQERELRNIIRPDMIHLLLEAKKGKLSHEDKERDSGAGFATAQESEVERKAVNYKWTEDDLVAQAVIFLIAGYDTVSSVMAFLLYEMALNPDIQDRLVEEIKEHSARTNGKFDYNSIHELKYLDMVVSETLRKWPPLGMLDRLCNMDYNLGKPNNQATEDFIIRKGEGLHIPVFAFHRDPEFYPDPEKFDPERFSDENKHKIKPFTYMPFGLGPRNCIGSRFALVEVKVMVYHLLKAMELSPTSKTQIPLKLSKELFTVRPEGENWIRFKIRN